MIAFRHGLRATEICDLEWSQVEFGRSASLHVRRAKNGKPSVHPLRGDEVRALRALLADTDGSFVFEIERRGPFTPDGGQSSGQASRSTSTCCGMPAATRWQMPAMIRARSIQHTVRYIELTPTRFQRL